MTDPSRKSFVDHTLDPEYQAVEKLISEVETKIQEVETTLQVAKADHQAVEDLIRHAEADNQAVEDLIRHAEADNQAVEDLIRHAEADNQAVHESFGRATRSYGGRQRVYGPAPSLEQLLLGIYPAENLSPEADRQDVEDLIRRAEAEYRAVEYMISEAEGDRWVYEDL